MLLKRFYHEGLAQASYLIGCQRTGEALVVDANRDIDQYLKAAAEHGLRVTHVTETHIHADYLSGSLELARTASAMLLLSDEGGPNWRYAFAAEAKARLLRDGDVIRVGNVSVEALHTPGHTPEHLTFVVTDTLVSDRPIGALTGDFIFVGDVGRPDLLERAAGIEGTMREGAGRLFQSIRRFMDRFPDYLQLWPGHGAGSACGKSLGAVPQSTLGYEKLSNWALQVDDESRFIEAVLEGQPDPPVYFATMKRLNRDGPAPRGRVTPPPHRAASDVAQVLERGDFVIDLRSADDFAAGFIPGTISIPLRRSFVGYAGWMAPYDRDIYVLSGSMDDTAALQATNELAMIGLDRVAGWFGQDALDTWMLSRGSLETLPQVEAAALPELLASGDVSLIDVRSQTEFTAGHVPDAEFAPLGRLGQLLRDRPRDSRLALICQTGGRSTIGASVLMAMGFTDVTNVHGGTTAWVAAGYDVEREDSALRTA